MIIRIVVKDVRLKRKITIKKLSYMTGISTSHLCDIENNNKMPSLIYAVLIANALNVNVNEIYVIERY